MIGQIVWTSKANIEAESLGDDFPRKPYQVKIIDISTRFSTKLPNLLIAHEVDKDGNVEAQPDEGTTVYVLKNEVFVDKIDAEINYRHLVVQKISEAKEVLRHWENELLGL